MATLEEIGARLEAEGVTVEELFECVGYAGHDIARAMRAHDRVLVEGASSALMNAIAMMPLPLRELIAAAAMDRSSLAPALQRLAF